MVTVVYQGSQSCLDSQIVEAGMVRLRFPAPKVPQLSQSLELAARASYVLETTTKELGEKCIYEETTKKSNSILDQQASSVRDSGGWAFFQALYNYPSHSQSPKEEQINKETTYVHPLVKRSLSKLSEESLKLCTENLGCETGSDNSEESILLLPNEGISNPPTRKQQKTCQLLGVGKATSHSFPPPLTTMSGSGGSLQVRPHREDGRLIIEAIKSPSKSSLFQAERSNGRLLLCLVKDSSVSSFDSMAFTQETEDNIVCNESDLKKEETESDLEMEFEEEAEEDGEDFEEKVEEGNFDESLEKEIADMGMEEFLKLSRCREAELHNKELLIWISEAFLGRYFLKFYFGFLLLATIIKIHNY